MKVSEQCGIAAAKGNQILGLIRRNIVYKEKELIIPLYKTIVRPHLEYCIQAWRPYRKKDIDKIFWPIQLLVNFKKEMSYLLVSLSATWRQHKFQVTENGYENCGHNGLFFRL